MKFSKILPATALLLFLGSCSAPEQINYFQDLSSGENQPINVSPVEIRIQPQDHLSITVNCQDKRLDELFNNSSQQSGKGSGQGVSGYRVSSKGDIDFPVLGTIHIQGMTREEIATYIKQELTTRNLVKAPVVTVDFLNLGISILGEVSNPGHYEITKDKLTILEALSQAGDLTIHGKRDNILVLRKENGKQQAYRIDIRSAKDVYSSPVYYLQQDDVVYVEPNKTKARQSTLNENNFRNPTFWISTASMLITLIVLLTN